MPDNGVDELNRNGETTVEDLIRHLEALKVDELKVEQKNRLYRAVWQKLGAEVERGNHSVGFLPQQIKATIKRNSGDERVIRDLLQFLLKYLGPDQFLESMEVSRS